MTASEVKYYAKSSSYVLEHSLKMIEAHLKGLKSGWGVRLKRRIAMATPLQRESYLAFEEKQYKGVLAQVEERISNIKAALAIAKEREEKRGKR